MGFKTYVQDPADVLKYPFDYQSEGVEAARHFLDPGVEIVTSTFVGCTGAGVPIVFTPSAEVLIVDDDHDETTTQVTVGLAPVLTSSEYYVTNHVVASDGQEKDWTIKIKVKEQ